MPFLSLFVLLVTQEKMQTVQNCMVFISLDHRNSNFFSVLDFFGNWV